MEQTPVEWLENKIEDQRENGNDDLRTTLHYCKQAKEMEDQQKGYSEEEVELITNEMVNWAIDNVGNPNPQSGKKFDEVIIKFKNK